MLPLRSENATLTGQGIARYKKPGAGPGFRIYMKSYCAAGKSMVAALKLKTYVLFDNCAFYFASKFVDHTAIYIVIRIFRFKS